VQTPYCCRIDRVQPVTPNVDAYPRRRSASEQEPDEPQESATAAGQREPEARSELRADATAPSASAAAAPETSAAAVSVSAAPASNGARGDRAAVNRGVSGAEEPAHPRRVQLDPIEMREKVAQLSFRMDDRDAEMTSLRQKLKSLKQSAIGPDDEGGAGASAQQLSAENERAALVAALKKLLAQQLRDATDLSSYQDQIENTEVKEIKQLLEYCEENIRVADQRRKAAAKVEELCKSALST